MGCALQPYTDVSRAVSGLLRCNADLGPSRLHPWSIHVRDGGLNTNFPVMPHEPEPSSWKLFCFGKGPRQ